MNVIASANLKNLKGSGLVGLGANSYSKLDMFIPKMKKAGVLKKELFSLYVNFKGGSSIQFGDYNLTKYAHANQTIQWHNATPKDVHWTLNVTGLEIG